MLVMVSNCSGTDVGIVAERYRGALGHLYSPGAQRGPWPELRHSFDNFCFVLWQKNLDFKPEPWRELLAWGIEKARDGLPPLWALVPDAPTLREKTLAMWKEYAPEVRAAGFRPAFAVQDDMTFGDVPDSECMLFLGGSTAWKMDAIRPWCARFPGRVHVGRVTEAKRLWLCHEAGAVSVDGNDWWRDKNKPGSEPQWQVLLRFLEFQASEQRKAA